MTAPTSPRTVTCERCGTAFECSLSGGCWCDAEPYRMPLPKTMTADTAQDCLCPTCLRDAALSQGAIVSPS